MIKPYGNILVDQIISNINKFNVEKKKIINLNDNEFINLINISLGYYSPLNRFCNFNDYKNIINFNKIDNNIKWTIPILLTIKNNKTLYKKNKFYALEYKRKIVGIIEAESFFKIDKKKYNKIVFGTNSKYHPGVKQINKIKNNFIGGKVYLLSSSIIKDKYFYKPYESRKSFYFSDFTVFSTRNICHLGHEYIHRRIINDKNKLLVSVIVSEKNKYKIEHIENTYNLLKKQKLYKKIKLIKIFLPSLFAGPKEAYLQAIIFQNLGLKKFFIGRDHAGVNNFYKKDESQKFLEKKSSLKIEIFKTKEPIICLKCSIIGFRNEKFCKNDKNTCKFNSIDGKFIKRQILLRNFKLLKNYLNAEIIKYFKNKTKIF